MAVKIITIGEEILGKNEDKAKENKKRLDEKGVFTVNIMSSPGAGKTSFIMWTLLHIKKIKIGVIEGDVAGSIDAEKINSCGIPAVQINTQGGCHLDAFMVEKGLDSLPLDKIDLLFIENVGNLICPNNYQLGEDVRLMITSVPEGDDKPLKYPAMFADTDVVILNKIDLEAYCNFNEEKFYPRLKALNPDVKVFPVSCKTGVGLKEWLDWVEERIRAKQGK